jgi:hypothetical protein
MKRWGCTGCFCETLSLLCRSDESSFTSVTKRGNRMPQDVGNRKLTYVHGTDVQYRHCQCMDSLSAAHCLASFTWLDYSRLLSVVPHQEASVSTHCLEPFNELQARIGAAIAALKTTQMGNCLHHTDTHRISMKLENVTGVECLIRYTLDSEGFWQWCKILRITGFLYFVHCLVF